MLSVDRTVLPAPNDIYLQIPNKNGSYLFSRGSLDRIIKVDCSIFANSLPGLRSTVRQIAAWLYTRQRVQLVFDDEPDLYYMAKIEGGIGLEQITTDGMFTLIFRCEPFAYGDQVIANFVNDSVTLTNAGTAETEPYFQTTFTAAATEWKITLGTDYCRLANSFLVGDVLVLDFATGAVLLNGTRAMNLLDWQNSRFFSLPVGASTLTVTPAGKSATLVKYTPKWR
jgi:predicted phage tail component-like protein